MTLTEVLAPFGVDESEFVDELSRDLREAPASASSQLSVADEALLAEHGGITAPLPDDVSVGRAVLRSSSSNLAEQARTSLSVEQAAALLGVDGSRVRHRVRDRALYAFKIGGGLRLPSWQFEGDEAIPGLRSLLAALPDGLHPLEIAGFMSTPTTDLTVDDEPVSPRTWLVGGGDVHLVVDTVAQLDTR